MGILNGNRQRTRSKHVTNTVVGLGEMREIKLKNEEIIVGLEENKSL